MFWHSFKYAFRTLLKSRAMMFWTLIFPFILAILFNMAFARLHDYDVFEAFVAALYLDQGFDFTTKFVLDIIIPYIDREIDFLHDYKSTLQELVQTVKKSVVYEVVDEEGPPHNKIFTSVVKIDGITMGMGTGSSKKASEQEAAKDALSKQAKIK